MSTLNPLGSLDRYLLVRYPMIWRARVLYVIPLSLIGFALAYGFGLAYPVSLHALPTLGQIQALQFNLTMMICAFLFFVFLQVWRYPLSPTNPQRSLLTIGYFFVCFYASLTAPSGFSLPLTHRIATSISTAEFTKEMNYHRDNDFWYCTGKATTVLDDKQLKASLKRFGYEDQYEVQQDCGWPYDFKSSICGDSIVKSCLVFTHSKHGKTNGTHLQERLETVEAAKQAMEKGTGSLVSANRLFSPSRFIFSLAGALLGFCLLNDGAGVPSTGSNTQIRSSHRRWKLLGLSSIKKYDKIFMIRFPTMWAACALPTIAAGTLYSALIIIAVFAIIRTGIKPEVFSNFGLNEGASVLTFFALLMLVGVLGAYFSGRQQRYYNITISKLTEFMFFSVALLFPFWLFVPAILLFDASDFSETMSRAEKSDVSVLLAFAFFLIFFSSAITLIGKFFTRTYSVFVGAAAILFFVVWISALIFVYAPLTSSQTDFRHLPIVVWSFLAFLVLFGQSGSVRSTISALIVAYSPFLPVSLMFLLIPYFEAERNFDSFIFGSSIMLLLLFSFLLACFLASKAFRDLKFNPKES